MTDLSPEKLKKIELVKALVEKFQKAKSTVFTNYQGVTHKQLEELRKIVKKVGGEFTVTKNNLLKRALSDSKKQVSESTFDGPTGTLFAYNDEVTPLKELVKFFKSLGKDTIKAGILGDVELPQSEVEKLAQLPSRGVLLAQLVGQLQAPLYGLHNALSWNLRQLVWTLEAVKSKKPN